MKWRFDQRKGMSVDEVSVGMLLQKYVYGLSYKTCKLKVYIMKRLVRSHTWTGNRIYTDYKKTDMTGLKYDIIDGN